jgi:hypothetical protein
MLRALACCILRQLETHGISMTARPLIEATNVRTSQERLQPGRYLVRRIFEAGDRQYEREMEVANPAYASAELDDWQDCILRRLTTMQRKAA